MKNTFIKPALLAALSVGMMTSCVKDDDFDIPTINTAFYSEDFDTAVDNTTFDFAGWTNFAEVGTELWTEEMFNGDGTVQFNPFGNGEAENISWIITPQIDITGYTNVKMSFRSAMNFVSDNVNNRVEVWVSPDYDGTNFEDATWTKFNARFATSDSGSYVMINSGEVDLSVFAGQEHISIGFKAIGSGSNTSLDGLYQINDLNVYTTN